MKKFFGTLFLVLLLAIAVALYLFLKQDSLPIDKLPEPIRNTLNKERTEIPVRSPHSYHILQAQGGIPISEAERVGFLGDDYAYLSAFKPIQQSKAIESLQNCNVIGKQYDMCWRFNTELGDTQVLEFNVGGKYAELHLGFAFEDSHPSDTTGKLSVSLSIQADGQEVQSPVQLTPNDEPWFGFVPIEGAQRVALIIKRVGHNNHLAPVLLDPFVRTALDNPRPEQ